jgi:hypothetical protein
MSLVEEVEKEIALISAARAEADDFIRLSAFYDEMKRLGMNKKHEYDLPLIDTVGRTLYRGSAGPKTRS